MDAKQVPLRELLASVPADARLLIDDADGLGSRSIPVGRLCQEAATALAEPEQKPQCNSHPKAPHGFLRNASHNENRYVCECEGWEPYEAGYQAGMEAALAEPEQEPVQEPVAWLTPRTVDSYMRPDLGYETCSKTDYAAFPVYTAPPQHKPLTQEDP